MFASSNLKTLVLFFILPWIATIAVGQQESLFEQYMVNALFDKNVRGELELVAEQEEDISKRLSALTGMRDELAAELREFKDSGASESDLKVRREQLVDRLQKEKQRIQKQLLSILLPHQLQRLKEVSAQFANREAMKKNKAQTGLLTPQMMEYLDINEDQADRIKRRSDELRKKLTEKIRKLNEQAVQELMGELSKEQREKYQKLMGSRFFK